MIRPALLAASLLLTATPAFAQSAYRAVGTEPFWSVEIRNGRMVYEDAEGRQVSVPTPRPAHFRYRGRQYSSPRLLLHIRSNRPCSDGMSDRIYPDTVRVTVDGRTLNGCGGEVRPPETLAGTTWTIASINGRPVPGGDRYRIAFEANRMNGVAGCNRFSGSYRVGRDGLQAGPLAMTRMACPGPAMAHEQAVGRILAGCVRLSYPNGTTMVMRGVSGGEIRLRRNAP